MSDDAKAKDIVKRLDMLVRDREKYETLWEDCIRLVGPYRRGIKIDPKNRKGELTGTNVYDGTPGAAKDLYRDGICGYMINQAIRWFELKLSHKVEYPGWSTMRKFTGQRLDSIPEVKQWLQDGEEVMFSAYHRSNFYDITPSFIDDGLVVGHSTLYKEEDIAEGRIVFVNPHPREIYIAEDRYGQVDTVFRKFSLSNRNLDKKFTRAVMTTAVDDWANKLEKAPYDEQTVIHAVYPRTDRQEDRLDSKNKPWASCWVLENGSKLLLESGYNVFPYEVWRYWKNNDEVYGRSPTANALIDIFALNQLEKSTLRAANKATDPPYAVLENLRGKLNPGPAGRTYLQSMNDMPQLLPQAMQGYPISIEHLDRKQKIVEQHMHTDFFFMLSKAAFEGRELTARQVMEMQGEKAASIGPRIGRIQSEFLDDNVDGVWAIEYGEPDPSSGQPTGRIPQMPQILLDWLQGNGLAIDVDYMGPLAQAQKKLFDMQNIMGGLEGAAQVAQLFPESLDNIDGDDAMLKVLAANRFPISSIRPPQKVAQKRQIALQQMQQQQMAEQMEKAARSVPAAGTAPESGSPLEAILGNG
jgi:hypothetical protein